MKILTKKVNNIGCSSSNQTTRLPRVLSIIIDDRQSEEFLLFEVAVRRDEVQQLAGVESRLNQHLESSLVQQNDRSVPARVRLIGRRRRRRPSQVARAAHDAGAAHADAHRLRPYESHSNLIHFCR